MKILKVVFLLHFFISPGLAQQIPDDEVIAVDNLSNYLKDSVKEEFKGKEITSGMLAKYFREKFSERFFYDWKDFENRFQSYKENYPEQEEHHRQQALDHMSKFRDSTQWVLPFNYTFGDPVDAYALRHLARQHKMVDIALVYHYSEKDLRYLDYFTTQLASLNSALEKGAYERIEDGNGVYEAFRSGYRILNWLWIHNIFLSEDLYSDEEQLRTLATLLQHGAHLYRENPDFRPGNHQTRGMSALAMVAILLRDFKGTEQWLERSLNILEQHLEKEINEDGFQFERSVHYHMSDIGNYFYVYRLAQISEIPLKESWDRRIHSLFGTLGKIAYPNKSAPVLQDDTNKPWAEKNDISKTMALGYVLFEEPEFGFFADEEVEPKMFWFLNQDQINVLRDVPSEKPKAGSVDFPSTGYYVMREGWNSSDKMMIITAGLDDKKPDHQHGDMLGIQAMANNCVVLPNYQVRYSLKDLEFFKNSLVKNVALVDNEMQGKEYTSNKGGSGFGKFRNLPVPRTIAWEVNDELDLYIGSHDGFEDEGVEYTRQVIYVKDDFWIIKDNFYSKSLHSYKQVWQGHYTLENAPVLLRSTFDNGSGLDILQLYGIDKIEGSGTRGKEWSIAVKEGVNNFSFLTVLFPFDHYSERIKEDEETPKLYDWNIKNSNWQIKGDQSVSLTKGEEGFFFSVEEIRFEELSIGFDRVADVFVKKDGGKVTIQSLTDQDLKIKITGQGSEKETILSPGEILEY